jgi:hypothetical protein
MPRYRVTLRHTTVEVVEAENPYQAAVVASAGHASEVEVTHVASAVGRPASTTGRRQSAKKQAAKKQAAKKLPAKKKRQLSPETRAKLAQNLTKARAARAAKRKTAATKKQPAKRR